MRLRKHNRAADSDRENCVRSQGAYFEGDWGVIVLCTVCPVSSMNVSIFHITWLDTFWTGLVDCDMITTIRLVNTPLLTVSVACAWWELFRSVLSASFRYTEWYYWLCPPSCVLDPGFTAGSFCPLTTSTRFPFTRLWQPSIRYLFLWVFFFFFFFKIPHGGEVIHYDVWLVSLQRCPHGPSTLLQMAGPSSSFLLVNSIPLCVYRSTTFSSSTHPQMDT